MITNVYVDGFNLYYGAVRGTPYKWLNLAALCQLMLPRDVIYRIRYFTALVTPRPRDPDQPVRQQIYLRALQTIPNLSIYYGHFLTHEVEAPLAPPATGVVRVLKTEEKGSDVNLATFLLADGFRGEYETAVIISNDSDLLAPLKVARHELGKVVGVLSPHQHHPSVVLRQNASFFKVIRPSSLARAQFPPMLTDARGVFYKPASW